MWKTGLVAMAARLHEHSRSQIENNAGLRTPLGEPTEPTRHRRPVPDMPILFQNFWASSEKKLHSPVAALWLAGLHAG